MEFAIAPVTVGILTVAASSATLHAQVERQPQPPHVSAMSVAVLPDGTPLIGRSDGAIVAIDAKTGKTVRDFARHASSIADLDVDPKGEIVAASSMDGRVALWRFDLQGEGPAERGAYPGRFAEPDAKLRPTPEVWNDAVQVEWTHDGAHLVTWSFDWLHGTSPTTAQLWSRSGELVWTGPHARQVDVHPTRRCIAAVVADKVLLGWPGEELRTIDLDGAYDSVEFSPDGKSLAVGGRDFRVWVLDANDGSIRQHRRIPEVDPFQSSEFIQRLRWSPDGLRIGVVAAKGLNPAILDAASLELTWVGGLFGARMWSVFDVDWTPEGQLITGFGSVNLFDPASGESTLLVPGEEHHGVARLGDSSHFILLSSGKTRRVDGAGPSIEWQRIEMANGLGKVK